MRIEPLRGEVSFALPGCPYDLAEQQSASMMGDASVWLSCGIPQVSALSAARSTADRWEWRLGGRSPGSIDAMHALARDGITMIVVTHEIGFESYGRSGGVRLG